MKKEQLHQLINANKKLISIKKPVKKLLKCILYSHTGKRILKQFEEFRDDLKHDLEIIFKPVKPFTKKQLKEVDSTTLYQNDKVTENDHTKRGTPTLHSPTPKDEFINWFAVDEKPSESKKEKKTRITLEKADGTIVGLGTIEDVF
tara:strand:+ start:310 stop:747 length:438 start_codon:yes stop_codon:yes gene_type:complete